MNWFQEKIDQAGDLLNQGKEAAGNALQTASAAVQDSVETIQAQLAKPEPQAPVTPAPESGSVLEASFNNTPEVAAEAAVWTGEPSETVLANEPTETPDEGETELEPTSPETTLPEDAIVLELGEDITVAQVQELSERMEEGDRRVYLLDSEAQRKTQANADAEAIRVASILLQQRMNQDLADDQQLTSESYDPDTAAQLRSYQSKAYFHTDEGKGSFEAPPADAEGIYGYNVDGDVGPGTWRLMMENVYVTPNGSGEAVSVLQLSDKDYATDVLLEEGGTSQRVIRQAYEGTEGDEGLTQFKDDVEANVDTYRDTVGAETQPEPEPVAENLLTNEQKNELATDILDGIIAESDFESYEEVDAVLSGLSVLDGPEAINEDGQIELFFAMESIEDEAERDAAYRQIFDALDAYSQKREDLRFEGYMDGSKFQLWYTVPEDLRPSAEATDPEQDTEPSADDPLTPATGVTEEDVADGIEAWRGTLDESDQTTVAGLTTMVTSSLVQSPEEEGAFFFSLPKKLGDSDVSQNDAHDTAQRVLNEMNASDEILAPYVLSLDATESDDPKSHRFVIRVYDAPVAEDSNFTPEPSPEDLVIQSAFVPPVMPREYASV